MYIYIYMWSFDGTKALPYRRASVKQHRHSELIFVCKMGKLQRGVQKFFKSGRPASEEVREESFNQASTSVNTEPFSQTVPEGQTKAELSGTLASREESFANE